MNTVDVVTGVIDVLNASRAPYMLVGSFSSNLYGIARNTNDADFVYSAQATDARLLASRLGDGFRLDPQMSFESVTLTTRHRIEHIETGFAIELFELSEDAHDQMRFSRRVRLDLLGRNVFVPTVEDVIVTKLRWGRTANRGKDISDVKGILGVQNFGDIDAAYVRRWAEAHGTAALWDRLCAET